MPTPVIRQATRDQLSLHDFEEMWALLKTVFNLRSVPSGAAWHAEAQRGESSGAHGLPSAVTHVFAYLDDRMVAHACVFPREVREVGGALFSVAALAMVAVAPEYQGRGLGRRAMEATLPLFGRGRLPALGLWQTERPGFYAKFGAVPVSNRFVNSLGADPEANPWWNPHIIIYPGSALPSWPTGVIDLRGPGY